MTDRLLSIWRRLAGGMILISGFSGCLSDDNLTPQPTAPAASPPAVPLQPGSMSNQLSAPIANVTRTASSSWPGLSLRSPGAAPQNRGFEDSAPAIKPKDVETPVVWKNANGGENQATPKDVDPPIVAPSFTPPKLEAQNKPAADSEIAAPAPLAIPGLSSQYPIDLPTALRLAGMGNPTIGIAEEAVRASQAEQLEARALLFPSLSGGLSYHWHDGTLQSSSGIIRDLDSRFFYAGAGDMYGSNVAIPGVYLSVNLGDAIYARLAARQRVTGRIFAARATRNSILLDVADRYFALAAAEESLAAATKSEKEFGEIARITANFAQSGQGRESDAERAKAEVLLLHDKANQAEEAAAVASSDLVQLLSLDAAVGLRTAGDGLIPIILVAPETDLESLLRTARSNRPEAAAAWAAIEEARTRLRQERVRPFLPLVSVGLSTGTFGGGSSLAGYSFDHFAGRMDFDVTAAWSLQNLGFGNVARARTNRAILGQAIAEQQRTLEQIAREVAEARALVLDRQAEVESTKRQLKTAEDSYRLDLERARNIQGRPIELLNSARLMETARQDAIRAQVGYNQAQIRLHVALGQPPLAGQPYFPLPQNP